ncbi:MAG: helix-turn-helix domain-containing protein [Desulfobacterales bacterium]|nr:helix-turn-helix domain-containing protein [Desulfobacterales bacterium]
MADNPGLSVTEIALASGFSGPSVSPGRFKERFGLTGLGVEVPGPGGPAPAPGREQPGSRVRHARSRGPQGPGSPDGCGRVSSVHSPARDKEEGHAEA